MEIKEGTFVVVVKGVPEFGKVEEIDSKYSLFIVKTSMGQEIKCNKDMLVPLAENCESVQDTWQRHRPEIIKNLAVMYHGLQRQVERLQLRSHPAISIQDLKKEVESLKSQTQWLAEFKKTRGAE